MVDLSHANSSKKHERQIVVAENIAEQIESGSNQIFGVMIESHLNDGAQKFSPGKDDPSKLEYGKSITDACINWEDSVNVLQRLALAVKNRRKAKK
jgi:3-deoxy-7-phosphoheptulonate synthase